ncbi:MAG TPA: monomeric [FeFe] hydrogenase [Prolixibacteraceae bacterium]|nr:monomeric [FeFe] hydrogenase [Prolixibacteraceae bacterium]
MAYLNNTMIIRRQLVRKVVRLFNEGRLIEGIDRIPLEMSPREKSAQRRCCIHKERAVIRYKMLPILGLGIEDELDELTPLSEFARIATERTEPSKKVLTVVDEACTSCVKVNYIVTNICRGCVASPCIMNCPKNAIRFTQAGTAEINSDKCVNCGLCKEACPYHAIVYVPIPCEEVCPVNAITKNEYGIEQIDESKCIYCGRCQNACPFGSIYEISNLIDILKTIQQKQKIIALVAPALFGQYDVHPAKVMKAVEQIGFTKVVEVARGAEMTTRYEAEELSHRLSEGAPFMTSSCCPSYVELTRKHIPGLIPFVSDTGSPMHYAAATAKMQHPEAKTVFIGPCIAKRKEAIDNEFVDYVLSFSELDAVFEAMDIKPADCEEIDLDSIAGEARGFAISGGVIAAINALDLKLDIKTLSIDGLNKKSINLLKAFSKGKASAQFIEVMACEGGCIAGPVSHMNPQKGKRNLEKGLEMIAKPVIGK